MYACCLLQLNTSLFNEQKKVAEEDNCDVTNNSGDRDDKQQKLQMKKQIEKLEIQLAQTKLQLVQSQCNTQVNCFVSFKINQAYFKYSKNLDRLRFA